MKAMIGKMPKNSFKYSYKSFIPVSVGIICLYALYLRIAHLYRHALWADEMSCLGIMGGTFLELLKAIPNIELCSYLSIDLYIIYPFFKTFSYNKWGLAVPSVIATVMGLYILYLICKRYFKSVWAYLVTFGIVCFNATLIKHATELRPYAFLPTLALAAFYLFQKIADLNFELNTKMKTGAVILFILLIWFHVYGILMFSCCFLFTLLSRYKEKDFKAYFKNAISFTGIILCFAMPFWLYSVFSPHVSSAQMGINTFEYVSNPLHNIMGFLKGIFGNLIGYRRLYFLLLSAIIPFVFSYEDRYKQLLFLTFIIIVPIGSIFIADILHKFWFVQRQFIWVIPFHAFFLGWCCDTIFIYVHEKIKKSEINGK